MDDARSGDGTTANGWDGLVFCHAPLLILHGAHIGDSIVPVDHIKRSHSVVVIFVGVCWFLCKVCKALIWREQAAEMLEAAFNGQPFRS